MPPVRCNLDASFLNPSVFSRKWSEDSGTGCAGTLSKDPFGPAARFVDHRGGNGMRLILASTRNVAVKSRSLLPLLVLTWHLLPLVANAQPVFQSYTITNFPGWNLIANQLDNTNGNNINNVIPDAPPGSVLYKFNRTLGGFDAEVFDDIDLIWEPGTTSLNPGEGAE